MTTRADALTDKYILPTAHPANARLRESGVSVWSIVALLRATDGDHASVAEAYELAPEELEAALAYFEAHRDAIEAKINLNTVA